MEAPQVVIRLTDQRENRKLDGVARLKPGLVIIQETDVHDAGEWQVNLLKQRLEHLIGRFDGNVVEALMSVVPSSGEAL